MAECKVCGDKVKDGQGFCKVCAPSSSFEVSDNLSEDVSIGTMPGAHDVLNKNAKGKKIILDDNNGIADEESCSDLGAKGSDKEE